MKPQIEESLRRHAASPGVSVGEYVQGLMAALGDSIVDRHKLYLDTRYWIHLRDAAVGRPTHHQHGEILDRIRSLVADGLAVCTVSDVAWMELFKQVDPKTRLATADLLDELSLGVALMSEKERMVAEIEYFLTHTADGGLPPIRRDRVWVKAGYVMGSLIPVINQFSPEQNRLGQKASVDVFWRVTHRELASGGSSLSGQEDRWEEAAARITAESLEHAHEIRSHQQAFSDEIAGALRAFKDEIRGLGVRHYRRITGDQRSVPLEQAEEAAKQLVNLLSNAFKLRREIMAQHIPSLYTFAMCHAAVRWDKSRKFNSHDLLDFHHASSGVPYHDAVFTEKPLRVLVTAGNTALDKTFSCTVLSKEADVLAYLCNLSGR